MLDDMTIIDSDGNFNLYYIDDINRDVFIGKACLNDLDMTHYNSVYSFDGAHILDSLPVYAGSPEEYFDIMFHCASPAGLYAMDVTKDGLIELSRAKSRFFAFLRERGSITMPNNVIYNDISLAEVTAAINPGSLALLSIPAFMVMCYYNAITIDREQRIGRGVYSVKAPPTLDNLDKDAIDIWGFKEYADAFHYGNFLSNNSDLFLTVYGLAESISVFHTLIANTPMKDNGRIENICGYEPFVRIWNELIKVGAMRDPFGDEWATVAQYGIENSEEINPDLHAAIKLSQVLTPCFSHPGMPPLGLAIFYGLIDVFALHPYFGIEYDKKFEY